MLRPGEAPIAEAALVARVAAQGLDRLAGPIRECDLAGLLELVRGEEVEQRPQLRSPTEMRWLPEVSILADAGRQEAGVALDAEQDTVGRVVIEASRHPKTSVTWW